MNLLKFITGLMPQFGKDRVLEDIRVTLAELDNVVTPNFNHASDFFRTAKLKADSVRDLQDIFYRNLDGGKFAKQPNMISEIALRVPVLRTNLLHIQKMIEEVLEADIIAEGLTARKASLIRLASAASFVSRYSIDLLNYVYCYETNEVAGDIEEKISLAPAVIRNVETHMTAFALVIGQLSMSVSDFDKTYQAIPEVVLNSHTAASVRGIYKETDVDPFSTSFIPGFAYSPIYGIRKMIAEWQVNRYKANKDKKRMLELRLLYLKLKQEKKSDPKVQSEIEYIQSRVDRIEREMREVEEDLDLGE